MKVAWFTPISANSAIARFSALVVAELAQLIEVEVWTHQPLPGLSFCVPIVVFGEHDSTVERRLRAYDAIVYNIGNHEPYHGAIWSVSRREPGIVILHDLFLHHLAAEFDRTRTGSYDAYRATVTRYYGGAGRKFADQFIAGVADPADYERYPLFEPFVNRQISVVTHSVGHSQLVERIAGIPAHALPLTYDRILSVTEPRTKLGIHPNRLLMLSVGYVNPNRRIDEVITYLGEDPALAKQIDYRVVGPLSDISYRAQLEAKIKKYRLQETVKLMGFTDAQTLATFLFHADICINLRHPITESASASLIEQMLGAKAIVVSSAGSYGELPDNTVVKIPVARERELFARTLRRLVDDPRERSILGQRALSWALERANPALYAANICAVIRDASSHVRGARLRAFSARVCDDFNASVGDALPWRIGDRARSLFGATLDGEPPRTRVR